MKVFRKLGTLEPSQQLDAENLGHLIDELLETSIKPSLVDKALGRMCAHGLPAITEISAIAAFPVALVAMEPQLTLQQVDEASAKLEDLAILILTMARSARHEVEEAIADVGGNALACNVMGAEVLAFLEDAGTGEFDFVDLTPEEVRERSKLVRSAMNLSTKRGKSKAS